MGLMCKTMGVSRAGFYAHTGRPESKHTKKDKVLAVQVKAAYMTGRKTYGSPRVLLELQDQGIKISRKRVIRLMQAQGLKGRVRRRYKYTTMSEHDQPIAPNLLNREFTADKPNQRWVGDTTELLVGNGKMYLAAILDLYSRYVVGWAISAINDRYLVIRALDMALNCRCPGPGLLHHSDQGCTYASDDHRRILDKNGIICSMSRRGNCYDNAVAESFFSTFKMEQGERFESAAQLKAQVFDYIEIFYNRIRRHSSIGGMSPADYERRSEQKLAA